MAPHSSTLAWKIPWTEEPARLQSMGSLRVGHDWATSLSLFTFMHWRRKWQPTPVFLSGESQGQRSLVGCCLWGCTESDTDWSDLAAAAASIESVKVKVVSDSAQPPWTVAHQAPLSMEFSRQEYWSGLPFPSPGDLPNPGIELGYPALQADSLPFKPLRKPPIKIKRENKTNLM